VDIPEGNIGWIFEILKVSNFSWPSTSYCTEDAFFIDKLGSSHQNYMTYLLEVYCLLWYEASDNLHNGIFINWLENVTGELGKWIEGDLLQEQYNCWLKDMIKKQGGDFDEKFYRQTLSPNVEHFLCIKEEIQNAFDLKI
jgi:hypothetical protein